MLRGENNHHSPRIRIWRIPRHGGSGGKSRAWRSRHSGIWARKTSIPKSPGAGGEDGARRLSKNGMLPACRPRHGQAQSDNTVEGPAGSGPKESCPTGAKTTPKQAAIQTRWVAKSYMAEREGFEPSIRYQRIHTFQACSFNHSDTSPEYCSRAGELVPTREGGNISGIRRFWQPLKGGG